MNVRRDPRMSAEDTPERMSKKRQIECQKIREKECQKICQKERQKICPQECQKIKHCQKICQKECQTIFQEECKINARKTSDDMQGGMSEDMPERKPKSC